MKKIIILCFIIMNLYSNDIYKLNLVNMSMDYKEYDFNNNLLDSEKSNTLIGLESIYKKKYEDETFFKINSLFILGSTDYKGSYLGVVNSNYGDVESKTLNYILDESIDYGVDFHKSQNLYFNVSLGFGAHLWLRQLSDTQNEYYYWLYFKPTAGIKYKINNNLKIGLNIIIPLNFHTKMYADNIDTNFDLGKVKTYAFSIPIEIKSKDNIFDIEFKYEREDIEASNIIDGYYEPSSTNDKFYIKFNLLF